MARQTLLLSPSLSLVIACGFWAAGTIVSKQVLGSVPPVLFLIIQLAPSAVALSAIALTARTAVPRGRSLLLVLILGILNPGLSYTLSMLGLVDTDANVATLLWAAEPIMIIVLARLVLGEKMGPLTLGLALAAAIGVFMASGASGTIGGARFGVVLILSGVACCAIYTIASRDIAASFNPLTIVALQQAAGLAWALAIWPFTWEVSAMDEVRRLSAAEITGGAVSGLMYYAAAFWFYLNGLRSMPASRAGIFFNLIPVFGIVLAAVFLGEQLAPLQWLGAVFILASVIAIQCLPQIVNSPE